MTSAAKSVFCLRSVVFLTKGLIVSFIATNAVAASIEFDRDIRPILSNNCYQCHGPDEKVRKAKLRLDTKEGATAAVVIPGKPEASELVKRLTVNDPDAVMPPVKTGKKLNSREVDILKQWIKEG